MASFTVVSATEHDLPTINELMVATFYRNPRTLSWHIFPHDKDAEVAEWSLRYMQFSYRHVKDDRWHKAVDTVSGKTAGFSIWQAPRAFASSEEAALAKKEKSEVMEKLRRDVPLPPGTNIGRLADFERDESQLREKYVDIEKDYILKFIAVSPDFQSQGCAKAMLKAGLETVDAAGARTYMEATPQGKGIYEKYGWREIDRINAEVEDGEGSRTHVTTCMMRHPHTGRP